jgi:hypothetical protein
MPVSALNPARHSRVSKIDQSVETSSSDIQNSNIRQTHASHYKLA